MARENYVLKIASSLPLRKQRANVIAITIKSGRVIAVGKNDMLKTHTCYFNRQYDKCIHAEFDALRQLRNRNLKTVKMYVLRFKKDGTLGNSKPCANCQEMISKYGVGRVYYVENGEWKQL